MTRPDAIGDRETKFVTDEGTLTLYGFTWGPMTVERAASLSGKWRELRVFTDAHDGIVVYVSEAGRSVRAFDARTGREMFVGPVAT